MSSGGGLVGLLFKCIRRPGVRLPELGGPWPLATLTLCMGNLAKRREVTH